MDYHIERVVFHRLITDLDNVLFKAAEQGCIYGTVTLEFIDANTAALVGHFTDVPPEDK